MTPLELLKTAHADLTMATQRGNLRHLNLEVPSFTGLLDAYGRARFTVAIPMNALAFSVWGAQTLSVVVPSKNEGEPAPRVVEIAPLRYGGELFASPHFAEEGGDAGTVHPMLHGDQVVSFVYPTQVAALHEWILTFCVLGE